MNNRKQRSRIGRLLAQEAERAVPANSLDLWPAIAQQLRTREPDKQVANARRSWAASDQDDSILGEHAPGPWLNPESQASSNERGWLRSGLEIVGGALALLLVGLIVLYVLEFRPRDQSSSVGAPYVTTPAHLVLNELQDETNPYLGSVSFPVDPDTLEDLPEHKPLELSDCHGSAPSPDGELLATVCTSYTPPGREVRLFNLKTWDWELSIEFDADGRGDRLTWSGDGEWLYVLTTPQERTDQGGLAEGPIHQLWIIDLSGARDPFTVSIPYAVYSLGSLDVAPDGSALYLLGYDLDPDERNWIADGKPFLAVLNPETGIERDRLFLSDLKVGRHKEQGEIRPVQYLPGIAMAPDGEHYYIAHADSALIDVIDLESLRIERTVDFGAYGTYPDRALLVSPDGRFLYVEANNGLIAVSTETWEVRWHDPDVTHMKLSPDGRWLYVTRTRWLRVGEDFMNKQGYLRVLNATTGQEVATLADDQLVFQVVFYGDDRVYVTVPTPNYDEYETEPYLPGEEPVELIAYDVGEWQEIARRAGSTGLVVAVHSE